MEQVMRTNEELHLHSFSVWGEKDMEKLQFALDYQKERGEELSWSWTDVYTCETDDDNNKKKFALCLVKCPVRIWNRIVSETGFKTK